MAENTHCLRVYSDRISKGKPRKRFDITPVIYIFVKTDTMKERIERILKEKSLSSNKLAEMLEVQPSGISHILSGRNKPSMDFITKLLTVFPDISPDWFILGKGDMYRTATNPTYFRCLSALSHPADAPDSGTGFIFCSSGNAIPAIFRP